jgi:hypothetical protein
MAKNADICRSLFESLPDHHFKCKYCGKTRRQLPSSGYGNLISHLKDKHADYEANFLAQASSMALIRLRERQDRKHLPLDGVGGRPQHTSV